MRRSYKLCREVIRRKSGIYLVAEDGYVARWYSKADPDCRSVGTADVNRLYAVIETDKAVFATDVQ